MTINELRELALHSVRRTAPSEFTVENVDAAFADGLKELAGTYNQFMKNRYDIYDIVIEAVDEILPKNFIKAVEIFAEVKVVPDGQKALFKKRLGKTRAKQFITRVGLTGVYETFRLDESTFELSGYAVGGGATVDWDRVVDGAESLTEVMGILSQGIEDSLYVEIQRALRAAINDMGLKNKYSANNFDANEMVKLMNVVRAYGNGIAIFAPPEFIAAMGPDAIVPMGVYGTSFPANAVYSPDDIESIHTTGKIHLFRGAPIVEIPQSFIDENNDKTWIDPQLAYILPSGSEKLLKLFLKVQLVSTTS